MVHQNMVPLRPGELLHSKIWIHTLTSIRGKVHGLCSSYYKFASLATAGGAVQDALIRTGFHPPQHCPGSDLWGMLGARTTASIGLSTLSLGQILSGFLTEHVGGLFVTAGIVSGVGMRFVDSPSPGIQ